LYQRQSALPDRRASVAAQRRHAALGFQCLRRLQPDSGHFRRARLCGFRPCRHALVLVQPMERRAPWLRGKIRLLHPEPTVEQWISNTPNIFWCASGHTVPARDNSGHYQGNNVEWLTDRAADGHAILETMADFQNFQDTMGRNSNFLQVAKFTPNRNLVQVYTVPCTRSLPVPSFVRNGAYEF